MDESADRNGGLEIDAGSGPDPRGADTELAELKRKAHLLDALFAQQSECVKLMSADGELLRINQAGLDLLGVPDIQTIRQRGLSSFFLAADFERFTDVHRRVCAGEAVREDRRMTTAEGSARHFEFVGVPLLDPVSGARLHLSITRDLSSLRAAETALRTREGQMRSVLDAAGLGEFAFDLRADSGQASWCMQQLCGESERHPEWSWSRLMSRVHMEDRPRIAASLRRLSPASLLLDEELRVVWPDGSVHWVWLRGVAEFAAEPQLLSLTGMAVDISARKQAELAAELAHQRLCQAMTASGDGLWEWDLHSGQCVFSERWAHILGHELSELGGGSDEWERRLHPDELVQLKSATRQHSAGAFAVEHRLRCKDGSWKWVLSRSLVVQSDEHGRVLRRIGTISDIDSVKRNAEFVEQLRQRLELAVQGSGFGVWEFDLSTQRLIWDEQMHRVYGFAFGEFSGAPGQWQACLHPEDAAAVDQRFADLLAGLRVDLFEFRILRKDNGALCRIEANGYLQRDAAGTPLRLVGMNRDVTARWLASQQLRLLGTSLSRLHDMVMIKECATPFGSGGQAIYANDAVRHITGCASLTDQQRLLEELLEGIDLDRHADHHNLVPLRCERAIRSRQGRLLWLELDVVAVPDEQERISHWVLIGHDVSERKHAADQIKRLNSDLERRVSERTAQLDLSNQELRTFAQSVSHDLMAPLRGIEGWTTALIEDCVEQLDARGRGHVERIQRETNRINDLLQGLLRLARISQAELALSEVDLSTLAGNIVERLRSGHPHRQVQVQIQPGLRLRADPALLLLTFSNLLENSWKFTATRSEGRIEISGVVEAGALVVDVRDNGVGFDMNHAADLFQPFVRLHRRSEFPGTGIGLAVVDRIVRRHGGQIEAHALAGTGAWFRLTFPHGQ